MVGLGGRAYVTRCHDCRRRKIKCDGGKPACQRCIERGHDCKGYARRLDFVHFDGKSSHLSYEPENGRNVALNQIPSPKSEWSDGSGIKASERRDVVERKFCPTKCATGSLRILVEKALGAAQYKMGLVSVMQERYHPVEDVFESWIGEVCRIASLEGGESLNNSLVSMSLEVLGSDEKNRDLKHSGIQHYSQALNGLRAGFGNRQFATLDQHQVDVSLVTCICCAMYELIANQNYHRQFQHLQGAEAMLKSRGVENLNSHASRRTFQEFRSIQLPICLTTRKVSFLCLHEWINPSWKSEEPNSASLMQVLLDHAWRLPPVMETFDRLQAEMYSNPSAIANAPNVKALESLIHLVLAVEEAINSWDRKLRGDGQENVYSERPSSTFKNSKDGASVAYPVNFEFSSFTVAAAFIYCNMVKIFLYQLIIDMVSCVRDHTDGSGTFGHIDIQEYQPKEIKSADNICQSTDYFCEDQKQMVGRLMILAPYGTAQSLILNLVRVGTGDPVQDALLKLKAEHCKQFTALAKDEGLPPIGGMNLSSNFGRRLSDEG